MLEGSVGDMKGSVLMIGPKSFPPKIGGIETHVYEISKRLVAKGWKITVAIPANSRPPRDPEVNGVRVRGCWSVDNRHLLKISMMPSIFREMRSNRYEVIHAHDATGGFASSIGSPRNRFVYTMHGLAFHPMDWPTPFRQGIELMQRTTMRNAAHVLCTDERTASEVARFRKQVEILSNGVDPLDFSKDMWPVPNEFDGEYYRILFVGRLAKVKGVDVLLRAIAGIPERDRRGMRFMIVGDGPMRGDVIAAARAIREIQYIGAIDHRSVPSYYVHSDAFVLPSLSEGLPISLLEAMASGLPSIASDVGGVKSQIPDCAVLKVPPSDPTALGDAITAMYHDRSARERIARSGLEIVEERFSWERIVDRLDKIYESLA